MDIADVADPPAVTPAERPVPKLGNVSMADVQRELEPGAGCELRGKGGRLLVATSKVAIARPGNKLIKLRFEGGELWDGGTFRVRDLAITISPIGRDGKVVDEVTSRPARAIVEADSKRETLSGEWDCGA